MAFGITLELREFDAQVKADRAEEPAMWMQKDRDRSLPGKARIRARREAKAVIK